MVTSGGPGARAPEALWLVRHGESLGNVAHDEAYRQHALALDLDVTDAEVDLSERGRTQAEALGRWLARCDDPPTRLLVSPYYRAQRTAAVAVATAGLDLPTAVDERLRDREQGVFDRLTFAGVKERYPEEAERRSELGKFWYRPPGGESWADVAQRIRALLLELRLTAAPDDRVLVVTHDVPLLLTRYALEGLSIDEVVGLSGQVRNCSLTRFVRRDGALRLEAFDDVSPIEEHAPAEETARD